MSMNKTQIIVLATYAAFFNKNNELKVLTFNSKQDTARAIRTHNMKDRNYTFVPFTFTTDINPTEHQEWVAAVRAIGGGLYVENIRPMSRISSERARLVRETINYLAELTKNEYSFSYQYEADSWDPANPGNRTFATLEEARAVLKERFGAEKECVAITIINEHEKYSETHYLEGEDDNWTWMSSEEWHGYRQIQNQESEYRQIKALMVKRQTIHFTKKSKITATLEPSEEFGWFLKHFEGDRIDPMTDPQTLAFLYERWDHVKGKPKTK